MKKIIVAPNSFKGSLSSVEACEIIANALEKSGGFKTVKMPLADGGDGTLAIAASIADSIVKSVEVSDPLGRIIKAEYVINGKTAIIESAKACGLTLLGIEERNPLFTTTYGVGQLVSAALSENVNTIAVTLGGSSTNDCGAGFLAALGAKFSGVNISQLPCGGDLEKIDGINLDGLDKRLKKVRLIALCDVENPLFGKNGAAYVYGPQKGADEETVLRLDNGLCRFARMLKEKTGIDISEKKGAGAAGGLGAALMILGAEIKNGSEAFLSLFGFENELKDADYVFTGEGRFDEQSFMGKATGAVYSHARQAGVFTVVFAGEVECETEHEKLLAVSINTKGIPLNEAIKNTKNNLYNAVLEFFK